MKTGWLYVLYMPFRMYHRPKDHKSTILGSSFDNLNFERFLGNSHERDTLVANFMIRDCRKAKPWIISPAEKSDIILDPLQWKNYFRLLLVSFGPLEVLSLNWENQTRCWNRAFLNYSRSVTQNSSNLEAYSLIFLAATTWPFCKNEHYFE